METEKRRRLLADQSCFPELKVHGTGRDGGNSRGSNLLMEATIISRVAAITAVQSAMDWWIDLMPGTGSKVLLLLISLLSIKSLI